MKVTDLKIDNKTLGKKLLLVDVTPCFIYENGNRTSNIDGYRYTVALPEHAFDKLQVKILGEQLVEKPEGYVEVTFEGLEIFIYWRNGNYEVGATATGIHTTAKNG